MYLYSVGLDIPINTQICATVCFFLVIELNSKGLFILTQFNRGESRHAVARAICHGQKGEIRKRYQDGQEDQLGALGLVTNAVVLWNTIYIQAALDHLRNVSTPRCLTVMGMRTISWTALSFQPALLAVHFGADCTQR